MKGRLLLFASVLFMYMYEYVRWNASVAGKYMVIFDRVHPVV